MTPGWWPFLFLAALAAGFVDSIAGGGGLITLPVLLGTGLPPAEALATNKLQSTFGSGSAAFQYRRARLVKLADAWPGIVATALGAVVGTLAATKADPAILRRVIPFLMAIAAVVIWRRPQLGAEPRESRCALVPFQFVAGLALGFYDGFFGPGTGTFWMLAFVLVTGFELLRATAWTKWMNFTSNVVSLTAFALTTRIDLGAGLVMGAGQWLGARLGARLALRGGSRAIRPVLLTVVVAATAKLAWDGWMKRG